MSTKTQFIIFDSNGNTLIKSPDLRESEESFNFQGIVSILGPIPKRESSYIFTLNIRNFRVDVCYAFSRYFVSIVPSNIPTTNLNCNSIYSYAAAQFFDSFMKTNQVNDGKLYEQFSEYIPGDPIKATFSIVNSLLQPNIEYVSFITRGNRVVLSLGAPSEEPETFIFSWIAATTTVNSITGAIGYKKVDDYPSIATFVMDDCFKVIVYFKGDATSISCLNFVTSLSEVSKNLIGMFKKEDRHKPRMPDKPQGPRRHFNRV